MELDHLRLTLNTDFGSPGSRARLPVSSANATTLAKMRSRQSSICVAVMISGGVKRIVSPCVGFANNPIIYYCYYYNELMLFVVVAVCCTSFGHVKAEFPRRFLVALLVDNDGVH
jgi:hypothetical protein